MRCSVVVGQRDVAFVAKFAYHGAQDLCPLLGEAGSLLLFAWVSVSKAADMELSSIQGAWTADRYVQLIAAPWFFWIMTV